MTAGSRTGGLTPIHDVNNMSVDVGGFGDPGICPGDSGGPALLRYPDGSWHVLGIASTLTGQCGGEGTHSLAWNAVPWIEEESGIDITPCHDVDGTWNPTHHCTGFYAADAGVGFGEFADWCPGTPRSGSGTACGPAFDSQPDNTAPVVTITAPMSASFPDMSSLDTKIEITADDGDGWGVVEVRVKINGDEQPLTATDPPYAFNVNFPKGTFEIVAVAEDAAGLIGESPPVVLEIGVVETPDTTAGPTSETDGETGAPEETGTPEETGDVPTTDASNGSIADTGATMTAVTATDPAMEGEDGCGCRSQPPASAALWLLALLGVRRRRSNTTALRA
jgi:MYXO-CTERM domain-containing protein